MKKRNLGQILRNYVFTLMILSCAALFMCAGVLAKNNTEKISMGTRQAQLAAVRNDEEVTIKVEEQSLLSFSRETPEILSDVLRVMPYPVNSIYILYENVREMVSHL